MTRLLGFDFGPKKIGLATGQTITATATPLTTLRAVNHQPDWQGIARQIDEWQPDALVVGLPLEMDGGECPITPRVRRFARQLQGRFGLPVYLADERLTSREARERSQGRFKRLEELDAVAAKLILETWMDERGTQDRATAAPSNP